MKRSFRSIGVAIAALLAIAGAHVVVGTNPAGAVAPYYSPSGTEGSIYRLYRAYFLREPDHAGLMYWYLQVAIGTSLDDVSERFAESSEFRGRYGSLGNSDFVELIYVNVLGRAADTAGRDYWISRLDGGLSRGRAMRFFSESSEYQSDTETGVPAGWRAGSNAQTLLGQLVVADELDRDGYDPERFPHWDDTDHDGCDTRCEVLAAEHRSDGWFSWWDAKIVTVSGYLEVDHVVDLAEAWDSGAKAWDEPQRDAFADWQTNLLATSRSSSTSKSDRDASEWTPPRPRSRCLFAEITVTTKFHWHLAVDQAEKDTLTSDLTGCTRSSSEPVRQTRGG